MLASLDVLPPRKHKPLRISTDILPLVRRSPSNSLSGSSSPTYQNTTPGTTPSTGTPQCSFHALCMHDFESSDPAQLTFCKGEVLTIVKQEHSGWWAAVQSQGDRIGWIPSSFVMPVDGNMIVESPDEGPASWLHDNLNVPLSAIHDQWVPAYEDHTALSFRLVSPIEPVLYKGFFDNRLRNHGHEPHFSLRDDERPSDARQLPPGSLTAETGGLKLNQPSNPPLHYRTLQPPLRRHKIDDHASFLQLTAPASSDEVASQLVSILNIEEVPGATSQNGSGQSQEGKSKESRTPGPTQGNPKSNLLDLTLWQPDNLVEQLCVLMHALYPAIRQKGCFDWIVMRRHTGVTGLRCFFDMHDYIVPLVQTSILAHDDMTRQIETPDFWVRVTERCRAFRKFDSLCGIILALSGASLSSLGSVWARCTNKWTFGTLRNVVDVNEVDGFKDIMHAATGPSVPFVRGCLNHIERQRSGHSNGSSPPTGHAAMVSALL